MLCVPWYLTGGRWSAVTRVCSRAWLQFAASGTPVAPDDSSPFRCQFRAVSGGARQDRKRLYATHWFL